MTEPGPAALYRPWDRPPPALEVWALEPYFAGSHRQFLEGLSAYGRHRLRLLTLPGRNWKWRMHGGGIRLAEVSEALLADGATAPDVLLATSMLDVPGYLALAPVAAARAPLLLYMHENQLTYPLPPGVERDLTYGVRQLAGAAAADRLLFNSAFHRDEFLAGAADLLAQVPDEAPTRTLEGVADRAGVLPLGVDLRRLDAFRPREDGADRTERPPLILWNQRWEYDKAPGAFFRALYALQEEGVDFRVAVAGPNRGVPTAEFVEARDRLGDRVVHWGMADDLASYAELLWQADVVVSTALHDFFGVSIVEAVYCGCRPVLPARLSYPELLPEEVHPETLYGEEGPVPLLRRALAEGTPWSVEWQRTWVAGYDWGVMAPRYDHEVWSCWEAGTRRAPLPGAATD